MYNYIKGMLSVEMEHFMYNMELTELFREVMAYTVAFLRLVLHTSLSIVRSSKIAQKRH